MRTRSSKLPRLVAIEVRGERSAIVFECYLGAVHFDGAMIDKYHAVCLADRKSAFVTVPGRLGRSRGVGGTIQVALARGRPGPF